MLAGTLWPWLGFTAFVLLMLTIDLGIFNRKAHTVSVKEAVIWSIVWITLAMIFNAGLLYLRGTDVALQFFTGYLLEKSLSVDNIFVFVLLFSSFAVPAAYQHRVLFWGILGALIMRGILIALGATLLEEFHWIIYVFGAFLLFTGIRMGLHREMKVDPDKNFLLKFVRRHFPITETYEGEHFFVWRDGKRMITPLLLVLIVIESTDLLFAVDSIPAIFAVTQDPFIVYTSNIFAILGLRSLYFVFAHLVSKFHYLSAGLAVILSYVGIKMLLSGFYSIPSLVSLAFITLVLVIAMLASLVRARREEKKALPAVPEEQTSLPMVEKRTREL